MNLEGVEQNYNISGSREGSGYVLLLTPRTPSLKKLLQQFTIFFNEALQVERTDMLQPNGDRIRTTYSNETCALIPPTMFQFNPPPGTNVTTPLGR